MHEWALADAVIKSVKNVAIKENLKEITEVVIKIGEIQSINEELFESALNQVMKKSADNTLLRNTKFKCTIEKAKLKCNICGHEWLFEKNKKDLNDTETESIHFIPEIAHVFMRCPECNSPDFVVSAGRGIWLDSIEGER